MIFSHSYNDKIISLHIIDMIQWNVYYADVNSKESVMNTFDAIIRFSFNFCDDYGCPPKRLEF